MFFWFMRSFAVITLLFLSLNLFAQAGRVKSDPAQNASNIAATFEPEKMFREANDYSREKFAEFQQKKVPFNENLRMRTMREQKELAAKYAAQLSTLNRLNGDDFYFLGMLYWLSENSEGTEANLNLFLESKDPKPERAQTARSILAVLSARRKDFDKSEKLLKEYLNVNPINLRERSNMEIALSTNYLESKNLDLAAVHAEEAYRTSKTLFQESGSRARGLADILETGRAVFEIYRQTGNVEKSDAVLEDLRKAAIFTESTGIYYYAADNLIKYMIETNRKPEALAKFKTISSQIAKDFPNKPLQDELLRRFNRRDKHYALLGATAPEMTDIEAWLPGQQKTLASLRGKIVLLDFWATWCGPCIDTFPTLIKLYQDHHKDGLEIVGLTRYYGQADGEEADRKTELAAIQAFKQKYRLPYDFAVADNQRNQAVYGATSIPTAVVIDRKGIVRYIESGTNANREQEIEDIINKILAEKSE